MSLIPDSLRRLPWDMLIVLFAITAFGLATLYSAAGADVSPWALNQGIRFIAIFGLMCVVSLVPVSTWMKIAYPFYAITLGLLLVVELFGKIGMGAQRWIDLGIIRLQPSEFMKIAVVLTLARFYHRTPPMFTSSPAIVLAGAAIVGVPAGLVMLQPDLGTAMMITFAGVCLMFLAGTAWRYFIGGGAAVLVMAPVGWAMLHDYQKNRILIFLDPDSDPLGTGYHISQSKIAIGSGGFWGKGFLSGTQSHLEYLPETHTDFIFATMMEEWGMIGGIFIALTYGYLIRWGSRLGNNSRFRFTQLTALGLSFTLFLYVGINLSMVMGLAPVVGIPLPLMSYGGSAMLTVLLLLGILMAFHRDEQRSAGLGKDWLHN
ncbi:rod shape-determining protein RodA [Sphingobium sp. YC-XJ3]|uniref:rod shape-determining protein RodA n=2 Tax=unclassified Sphingobium TaxID=2611147 RepID=UPI00146C9A6E|nr:MULTISPECIES: rod shape-determining protein RodA [unclassified Sphingobium]NML91141.1 rod shape-determining protein RodA [Sphingobium sp. TB-6]WDA36963.1 rod shape-determining protein RodA [Sphingobium sp. YC-XJ3]